MAHLLLILILLVLLGGFVALVEYETRRGRRFFEPLRADIDAKTVHATYVAKNVDFVAFFQDELHRLILQGTHIAARLSLRLVRAVERVLTRFVRYLHGLHAAEQAPREEAREFVRTLSDFKGSLKSEPRHPERDI